MDERLTMGDAELVATIGRGSSRRKRNVTGPDSRRFYRPVEVLTQGERVVTEFGGQPLECWPEEAEDLGLALIRAATLAAGKNRT